MQTSVGRAFLSPLQCQNILAAQLKFTENVDFIFEIMEHINKPFLIHSIKKYFTRNLFNKISTMP